MVAVRTVQCAVRDRQITEYALVLLRTVTVGQLIVLVDFADAAIAAVHRFAGGRHESLTVSTHKISRTNADRTRRVRTTTIASVQTVAAVGLAALSGERRRADAFSFVIFTHANAVIQTEAVAGILSAGLSNVTVSAFALRYAADQATKTVVRTVVHAERLLTVTAQIAGRTFALRLGGVVYRVCTPATVFTAHQRIVWLYTLLATSTLVAALALASWPTVGVVVLHDLVHKTDARIVAELFVQTAVRLLA